MKVFYKFNIKAPALGLFFLYLLTSCTWGGERLSQKPVLIVNEKSLTLKEFSLLLTKKLKGYDALSAKNPQIIQRAKNDVLTSFIIESIVESYAKQNNIHAINADVESEINRIRLNYPDDISFRKTLAEENLSLTQWKVLVEKSILAQKVFNQVTEKIHLPSEAEIQNKYREGQERYRRKERILLRQIVVDDITKSKMIHEALKKEDFATLAKKYSVSPEAKSGGVLGWVEKGTVDIFDKAFNLQVGGTSQVLESTYGFHIFRVERKLPAGFAPLTEVKKQIEDDILAHKKQGEYLAWLDRQIRLTKVFKDSGLLDSLVVETIGER